MTVRKILLFMAAAASAFAVSCSVSPAQNLTIYCVWGNGGSGTCTVVKGSNGTIVLLDETGGATEANALYNDILAPNGINYIHYAIAGHYDGDHIGGLDNIVSRMGGTGKFGTFYDRGGSVDDTGDPISATYLNLVNSSGKRATPSLNGSSDIDLGSGAVIRFLSVGAPDTVNALHIRGRADVTSGISENDKSISVLVTYGGFDFYFGSDLEGAGEQAIAPVVTQDLGRNVDILHVDHHGSDTNGINSLTFFQTMGPQVAMISVWNNSNGHPRRTTVERLEQVVEPLPQRIIRLAPGDVGKATWAPEDMPYCLTTNRHVAIATDGNSYTVSTVPRSGGNDITEPGLTNHPVDQPSNIPTATPIPPPGPPPVCPLLLRMNKSAFSSSDTIVITANACVTSSFTPYIRFSAPGGIYYYLTSAGALPKGTASGGIPYLKGPLSIGSDVNDYVVARISFSGVAPGSYVLQGGFVGKSGVIGGIADSPFTVQ